MEKISDKLAQILMSEPTYAVEDKINKNYVASLARQYDEKLLALLLSDKELEKFFFVDAKGNKIFKKDTFLSFINNNEFLPDSFTAYKTRIGLGVSPDSYIYEDSTIVLNWPYKDCILEGGQDKDDAKREEVFFNETLAPDQINTILDDKVFTNWKRCSKTGEKELDELNDDDNMVIRGNNLVVLRSLRKRYADKIKLIYIDPPYNTKGDANSFSYNNTFNHSTWLTFMKNRLEVARELLKEDGFIAIAIDHSELFYLGVLADEIFGRDNRVGIVTVVHKPEGRNQEKFFGTSNEFMLVYAKNKNVAHFNKVVIEPEIAKKYDMSDEKGNYRLQSFIRMTDGKLALRSVRPKFWYPVFFNKVTGVINTSRLSNDDVEIYPISQAGVEMSWKSLPSTLQELIDNGEIICQPDNTGKPMIYEKIRETQVIKTHWIRKEYNAIQYGTKVLNEILGKNLFGFPKSVYLVEDVIKIMADKNDLVLDFFSGSGTTGHAVMLANKEDGGHRKFILIEQMDYIEYVTKERLQKLVETDFRDESFVYCNIKNDANIFREAVRMADDKKLGELLDEVLKSSFLSYRVDPKKVSKKEFDKLSTADKKRILMDLVDNNTLYLNYSEINDKTYNISDADKKHNKEFYGE